jgi:SPP1 gp7 family putative phage head morphogenesis protein
MHLVDRMVVEAGLAVVAYTDRLMRALEPLLQERFGRRLDGLRHDAAPSLDEVFAQVREGEISRGFLERMFRGIDQQAANDLSHAVPAISPDQTLRGGAEMQAAFIERNVALIDEARVRREVRAIIEQPITEGVRVEEIRAQIQERLGVTRSRAELIARDQTLKTYGQIQEARQTDAGIEEYTWSTSLDERVRSRHIELEGTTQRWDAPPLVDRKTGRREHPGGDYQCRCAAIPILPTGELEPISETRPSVRAPRAEEPPEPESGTVQVELERQRLAEEAAARVEAEARAAAEAERRRLAAEVEAERQRALELERQRLLEAQRVEAARLAAEAERVAAAERARLAEVERQRLANPTARLEQRIGSVHIPATVPDDVRQAIARAVETVDLPGVRGLEVKPMSANGAYTMRSADVVLKSPRKPDGYSVPDIPGRGKLWSISSTGKTEAEAVAKTAYHELGHHAHMYQNPRFVVGGTPTGQQVEDLVEARWKDRKREYLTDYAVDRKTPTPFRASEYFAEAFAAYHTEPTWLLRVAPKAHKLVEDVLKLRRSK